MYNSKEIAVVDDIVKAGITWLVPSCTNLSYWRAEFTDDLHLRYDYPVYNITRLIDMVLEAY